ncbi:OsmC family protein [Tuanshanicoccus lijuaniae]|uniref:OsmC family protein n=1 Tax=Aerococcaceae bacterium zg-1292 TaxID=2774330 RepID=UPI0019389980|nr:OsmC family protein [Aerococcaceae bacterium zg-1292]MBF6979323.1 OsmC family protein [Aerococcaceae bacterium zg-BR22]QQA37019.1 OsmC family protein [Aerococcaceae bacterium zg-1292]
MEYQSLYHTQVINKDGIEGVSYVNEPNGLSVTVSSPMKNHAGTNPEQLLGLSLATCLNATIEAEEKRRGYEHQTVVTVEVDLAKDNPGYQFFVTATVQMPHLDANEAASVLATSLTRCPVAKLLQSSDNVNIQLTAV